MTTPDSLDDYHRFTRNLILTSIGTIVLSSALTSIITTYVLPLTSAYFPGWIFPLVEAVAASALLFHVSRDNAKHPEQKVLSSAIVSHPSTAPAPKPSPVPSEELENIFMPRRG